ncbi:hypothetical protein OROHE_003108 [Orobanche hederae]
MHAKELDKNETNFTKKQENSGRILKESESLEGSNHDKDLKLDTIIDISGKTVDFPLVNGEERLVEEVYMYKNELNLIPRAVGTYKSLKTLKFFSNQVNLFPGEFGNLVELEYLQVKISAIGVNGLELENLDLSNNRLTSLECLEFESMHHLRFLNIQHNQLRRCRIPSWICCNLEGNVRDLSNDEYAEMDVNEGVFQEIHGSPCTARRAEGWKRRYNMRAKPLREQSNTCKKWKVDAASQMSSAKCLTCRVPARSDNGSSKGSDLSLTVNATLTSEDLSAEGKGHVNSLISPGDEDFDGKEVPVNDVHVPRSSLVIKKAFREGSLRSTNGPSYLSCQYSEKSFCGIADHLPDGFYDAGRDRPFRPLDSYEFFLHVYLREVILLDRKRDEELDAILLRARAFLYQFKQMANSSYLHRDGALDSLQIASLLALFVSDHFGGSDKSAVIRRMRKAVSGSNHRKPFVCTCATGVISDSSEVFKQGVDTVEDDVFHDIFEKHLQSIKERRNSVIVPIGGLQFGVCRHRALLMKYLCDQMEPRVHCELVRGYLDFSPHAWNVIVMEKGSSLSRMIVDACHPHDIREESDPKYFCRYIPLSRVSEPVVTVPDASPNCSFPSVTVCDEIGKSTFTSLARCNIGQLEIAAKVRTIEANGLSADDVRNFEFCCLGEVRMLSSLKHSCIVEFYGHQISSKWSVTADGNSGGHALRSALLMEYIKGGSLKCYVDKLSSAGEKHVALKLALSIARDVAFALSELHSRHIIHRDVKSENILIDLERKRPDDSPIMKICDFDRAIPLHSHLHTCCIAHVRIPPPDICVGTPRWMAPEVFGAMHQGNLYGLEVDIWSFGCVLLELLTLQVPYADVPEPEIHKFLQEKFNRLLNLKTYKLLQSPNFFFSNLQWRLLPLHRWRHLAKSPG